MDTEQLLRDIDTLDRATALLQVNRADHHAIIQALSRVRVAIMAQAAQPEPPPEQPAEPKRGRGRAAATKPAEPAGDAGPISEND